MMQFMITMAIVAGILLHEAGAFGPQRMHSRIAVLSPQSGAKVSTWGNNCIAKVYYTSIARKMSQDDTTGGEEVSDGDEEAEIEEEEEEGEEGVREEEDESDEGDEEKEAIEEDPELVALKKQQKELEDKLAAAENQLRAERRSLVNLKDQASESGKGGYFMVQAQVAEFKKSKDAQQKARVAE
jgi:hypothetical protein